MPVYIPVDFALVRSNWVYRMFDVHGQALYVGKTCDTKLMQRLAQHLTDINPSHRKVWRDDVARVDAAAFDTAREAAVEETLQIRRLRPKFNKAGLPPPGDTLAGLEW